MLELTVTLRRQKEGQNTNSVTSVMGDSEPQFPHQENGTNRATPPAPGNKLGGKQDIASEEPRFSDQREIFFSGRFKVRLDLLATQECRFKTGACFRVEPVERKKN